MSKNIHRLLNLMFGASLALVILSCDDEDPPLPDNKVTFESSELGIEAEEESLVININTSREVSQDVVLTVKLEPTGLTYGTEFTTEPAAVANIISLNIPAGEKHTSFSVVKVAGVLLDGEESVKVTLTSVDEDLVLGDNTSVTVSFSEILAKAGSMEINGGGTTYPNKVFIDLSAQRQLAVDRESWDLGFYSGNDFKVILNSSVNMLARPLDKTDLNAVTASDTTNFKKEMVVGFSSSVAATAWIDAPSGSLDETAIDPISATAGDNKVYIINRGGGAGKAWKKIRILRNANGGYTLQHADIGATSFSELTIPKSATSLFSYIHFENGAVEVEPVKEKWDIAWTYFVNTTMSADGAIPYGFQDIVLQNRHEVETAKVLTSQVSFADFNESHLASLSFSSNTQLGIGADWRRTQPTAAVNDDRFYIVKDADENYYKIRFVAVTTDGQRGRPQVEFALVKKGS